MRKKIATIKKVANLLKPEIRRLKSYSVDEFPARLKMDAMENPFPLPDAIRQELAEALKSVQINRYPDPSAAHLKISLADLWGIGTQRMVLGNGSDELIQMIVLAFDGPVLVPVPTFAMYEIISKTLAQSVAAVPLKKDFSLDADKMLKKARDVHAKVIFLACPNNPTGNRFSDESILKIVTRANAIVVIDEAYFSFSGKTFLPLLSSYPNMIILRTLSKIGFAGLRIGALATSSKLINELAKIRLPYNINTLSQAAAVVALRHKNTLNRQISLLISARERLYNALSQIQGITAYPSEANFILFRTSADAAYLYEKLKESGILIKNLSRPGVLSNCLRVTVGTPEENNDFVGTVKKILKTV